MAQSTPLFVGLDVHKDSIAVAHEAGGRADPPVFVGAIGPARPTSTNRSGACRRVDGSQSGGTHPRISAGSTVGVTGSISALARVCSTHSRREQSG